jgi:hypothetical protein
MTGENIDLRDRNQVWEKREIWESTYVTNRAKTQVSRRGRKEGRGEAAELMMKPGGRDDPRRN